jgi:uncharacterized membrane protein
MKNYLKHLKERPAKILWLLFIWVFSIVYITFLTKARDIIIEDNNSIVYGLLWIFIIVIFSIANYQPYKEYKDGL